MSDVTRILLQIEQGDPQAAEKLLPLVYEELRKLATAKLGEVASEVGAWSRIDESFVSILRRLDNIYGN